MSKAVLVACSLLGPLLFAQPQPAADTERLIATGKLWTTVKYFHPYLAYRDIDWDKALVQALPRIRSASGPAEYAAALQSMLNALDDPTSYASVDAPSPAGENPPNAALKIEQRPDGGLVVSQVPSTQASPEAVQQLTHALASTHMIVFDLRVRPGEPNFLSSLLDDPAVSKLLTRAPLDAPAQRTWVHNGLPPASQRFGNGGYNTAFSTIAGTHFDGEATAPERKIAFLLNENSLLPQIGCALWAEGRAAVLSESPHFQFAGVVSVALSMGEGVTAMLRLSEPVLSREIVSVKHDTALAQALARVASPNTATAPSALSSAPAPKPDLAYAGMPYPATEYRVLAAYKIWAAFRNFFAYRDLMDEDWDDVFTDFLPKFVAAKDARDYALTVAEMVTHVADSHAFLESAELAAYFGQAPVGLRLQLIEHKPAITELLDPKAAKAGIHVGDVVTEVDGESLAKRIEREGRYIAASTRQSLGFMLMQRVLNGPEDSTAVLAIESPDGQTHEVRLKRESRYEAAFNRQRSGDVIKLLAGNIGYADLDRLMPDQVDGMFDRFRSTKAIIFDMRGYPHGTAWSIAPRLTERQDVAAAIFNGPLGLSPDLPSGVLGSFTASYFFVQKLPTTDKWKYKGKTVMLIDERTMSQAEHTGLFLEAANKTEFIGTPSAGANGDVTNFVVPGGITIWFSGHDVRHANGGALQRLGLQPSVTVAPSLAGIRAGRDEVLEKAIAYLSPAGAKGSVPRIAAAQSGHPVVTSEREAYTRFALSPGLSHQVGRAALHANP